MRALDIAFFEFRSRMRLISTHAYFAIFAAFAALWMAAVGDAFKAAKIADHVLTDREVEAALAAK